MPIADKLERAPTQVDPELHADWVWAFAERQRGALEEYAGQHIAILRQRVVGSGDDPTALREEQARIHGVRPERLVGIYIESLQDLLGG